MEKHHGHKHMSEILDGDHEASVKHRGGKAVKGLGGLAPDMSSGYEHGSREEEFKHGGWTSHKHHGK